MTARTANIDLALTIVSAAAANLGMAIDAVEGGVQIKLNEAVNIEIYLEQAAKALEANLQAARSAVSTRISALRAQVRESALVEVVSALHDGTLTLADIAARAQLPMDTQLTFERVANVVTPASTTSVPQAAAGYSAPTVDAQGAPLAPEIRENLRLQAGYLHPVKFRDPSTGAGWSGRGPTPKWLKALCVGGKTPSDFAVGATPASTPAPPTAQEEPRSEPSVQQAPTCDPVQPQVQDFTQERVAAGASGMAVNQGIGEDVVSFEAFSLDADLNSPTAESTYEDNDDLGDMLPGIAAACASVSNARFYALAA